MRRTTAQRDQELDWLREELIEEVRLCWQSDDRWAPWGPPDPEEWYLPWKPKDRLTRQNHNSLMRAHVNRVRALDSVRAEAMRPGGYTDAR